MQDNTYFLSLDIGRNLIDEIMPSIEAKDFYPEVYDIVKQIPQGKIATYGLIARLAGRPNNSRLVGQALKNLPSSLRLPCHRVVNSAGRLVPLWTDQHILLEKEGITFKPNGCVNLKKHLWQII